jgi:hypothetical protein
MILKNDELLHEFYSREGHNYPELNLDQVKEGAFHPWVYLRKEMESGQLRTMRLKYFGTFQVYEGRAKRMLINLKERFKFNKIEPKQYEHLKTMIETFVKRKEDERNK